MLFWISLILFTCLLLHVWTWWLQSRRATKNHIKGPVLLVTAHPDDETMFFSPTLLWLKKANVPVDLLCFSAGNFEGLGAIRANELRQAVKCFGIRNLRLLDSPTIFPDSPSVEWCPKSILEEVERTCERWGSRTLITFDEYGVSSHPNHCAISSALRTLTHDRLPDRLWLQSVHVFRKYCWIIDTLSTALSQPGNCLIFYVPLSLLATAYTTMCVHRSQLVWYRWFYILFSVYMYKNTLVKA
ncbi:N-acetylglucosaminylphosphatidylinositol deacetylase [Clonorchis sinensis]|uniref:N-acetylglucosaminylphosphatidylinositol deacetylase n=1 Tax=Clonorchis sinensis TaxID=79923 RepID=G7YMX5_CLOSI|nr:N-acetylglucosaminylphosphatidylinositol deacetylase [Clonorchis sinensis]